MGWTRVNVGILCGSGINHSVSAGRILSHVIDSSGIVCGDPNHLGKGIWARRNVCPGDCSKCVLGAWQDKEKTAALEAAFRIWNKV